MLAGPSEVVVLADEEGDAALIASDLLSQAEHPVNRHGVAVPYPGVSTLCGRDGFYHCRGNS